MHWLKQMGSHVFLWVWNTYIILWIKYVEYFLQYMWKRFLSFVVKNKQLY